jgi:hypothetical protein
MNPASSTPPDRRTRWHSRQTGNTSGTKTLDTGWKTRSKLSAENTDRSAMSPCTHAKLRSLQLATSWSRRSCSSERSKLVTCAPAAASTGACWPPPDARQSTRFPRTSPSHSDGTGLFGVRTTDHAPVRAAAMTSAPTGVHHSLPSRDSRFHASRLWPRTSMLLPERPSVRDQRRRAAGAPLADRTTSREPPGTASGVTTRDDRCIALLGRRDRKLDTQTLQYLQHGVVAGLRPWR